MSGGEAPAVRGPADHSDRSSAPRPLRLRTAARWDRRLRGLLFSPPLADDEALELVPCNSVHTMGMQYPIDVVFVDRRDRIVRIVEGMPPGRAAWCWRAARAIEFRAGHARLRGLRVGGAWMYGDRSSCGASAAEATEALDR